MTNFIQKEPTPVKFKDANIFYYQGAMYVRILPSVDEEENYTALNLRTHRICEFSAEMLVNEVEIDIYYNYV